MVEGRGCSVFTRQGSVHDRPPPSRRFPEIPAESGDEAVVGVAPGVGHGAGKCPAIFLAHLHRRFKLC